MSGEPTDGTDGSLQNIKLILIGGTSHAGKSTLGRQLADERGWDHLSTDQLARHPGRPWTVGDGQLPDHVVEHYSTLSVPELLDSVLSHYRTNVWPIVDAIVRSRLNNPFDRGLVLEGSAILPNLVSAAAYARVREIWLTASDDVITRRIEHSSAYHTRTAAEQRLVDAFIQRAVAMNGVLRSSAEAAGRHLVEATSAETSPL